MPSYEAEEAEFIYAAYPSCDVWSIAVVKVFKAVGGKWVSTGITGAAVMASEKSPAGDMDFCYIHVLDLKTNKTVLSQELYFLFEFNEAAPWFFTFESNEHVYGLSFADEGEAADFYGKVVESVAIQTNSAPQEAYEEEAYAEEEYDAPAPTPVAAPRPSIPPTPLPPSPASTPSFTPAPPTGSNSGNLGPAQVIEGLPMKAIPIRNALIGATPAAQPKQAKKGSGGGLFKMFGGKKKEEPVHVPVVGVPTDFKHESHIGWDPERGFEIRNIPPEWKALFQSAGIKKSELKDAETAKFIVNTVADVLCGGGAPPPPPPPPGGGPPPPPAPNAPRPPPTPGAPPPPGGGGASRGGGLLDQIRQGKELKKSDAPAGGLPDLTTLDTTTNTNLVDILSQAMMARRVAVERDSDEEEADESWD